MIVGALSLKREIRFRISGLVTAGLCQKTEKTFASVASHWNELNSDPCSALEVNISINHYPAVNLASRVNVLLETEPTPTWPLNGKLLDSTYLMRFAARSNESGVRCLPWFNEPSPGAFELPPLDARGSKFTMIAADKFSAVSGELYSLRRRLAREFHNQIDLFGPEWDFQLPRRLKRVIAETFIAIKAGAKLSLGHTFSYLANPVVSRGLINHKTDGYRLNRFALVIENSMELRTEKLYDALESGCVPVYVGPECEDGIPKDLYLHAEPSFENVALRMKAAREIDFQKWGARRLEWLESDHYKLSAEARFWTFLDKLAEEIEDATRT